MQNCTFNGNQIILYSYIVVILLVLSKWSYFLKTNQCNLKGIPQLFQESQALDTQISLPHSNPLNDLKTSIFLQAFAKGTLKIIFFLT